MEFYGLLGEKLSYSLSPKIHSEILKSLNKNGAYKLFEIDRYRLKNFTEAIKLLKISGCNVTIPYKKDIMKYIDIVSEEANKIGAVNTIFLKDEKLYGYNTDYFGFGYMLKTSNIDVKDRMAVILGNGGASSAVLHYLLDNGAREVYIVSRNPNKEVFEFENTKLIGYEELNSLSGDILINTTPVGMYPNIENSPVSKEVVDRFSSLVDLIYNPMETKFLSYGKESNKQIVDGLYMLVGQAVKAQEIWQDTVIDDSVIENIYRKIKMNLILS